MGVRRATWGNCCANFVSALGVVIGIADIIADASSVTTLLICGQETEFVSACIKKMTQATGIVLTSQNSLNEICWAQGPKAQDY